ncbi:MAG: cation diffusion facilitator family transporter [Halovenus sp.]
MGHDHEESGHGHSQSSNSPRKLAAVAGINILGFIAELAGGLLFGSVALLSDAMHMLFDALAYVMAFAAAAVANRYDGSAQWSYGLHRLEPLAAFLNGALLIPMVIYIVYESSQRFLDPTGIGTGPTLAIAVAGLGINLVSVYVVQGGEMNLNERGAFYHLLGDAGGSVAVIVSVVAIDLTGLRVIDPAVAILIAGIVLWSAGKLLRGSGAIFLHKAPITHDEVQAAVQHIDGVESIEDLHTWQICSELTIATVHVRTAADTLDAAARIRRDVHEALADHGVNHATVELLPRDHPDRLDAHTH